jgi:hypothetical protein
MAIQKLSILLLIFTCYSCNQAPLVVGSNSCFQAENDNQSEKILNLLNKALTSNTVEFESSEPFLFFKSGNFLNSLEKNALIVTCSSDSTYLVRLYSIELNDWELKQCIDGLYAVPIFFGVNFEDYNFDGQNDLYIRVSSSNGYSLSYGHLLTLDPISKEITEHIESRRLANIKPDIHSKTIISEEVIWCKQSGIMEICRLKNIWEKGVLKTVKKNCPCEPE